MRPVPFHVVGGFLGTGKTTTVRRLVAARAGTERAAVVVNDFGEAAVDAALLEGGVSVTNIAGGCVCCTAPEGLVEALRVVLDTQSPDRVFIEPSGLANPSDVVDMIIRSPLAGRLDRQPLVVLVDPGAPPDEGRLDALLDAADVVILNRCDLAPLDTVRAARAVIEARWPPVMRVVETSHGRISLSDLGWAPGNGPEAGRDRHPHDHAAHDHAAHDHAAGRPGLDTTSDHVARSWAFPPDHVLRYDVVRALAEDPRVARLKGLLRTDLGWFRVDRAGGHVHAEATPWRRDSRLDVILGEGGDPSWVEARVAEASAPISATADGVQLEALSGEVWVLDRARLAALPGQVADVSTLVPGRAGSGVWLREVLALAHPPADAAFVVVAGDGMTTPPTPVRGAGEAVLLHSLGAQPLPAGQGGPYRILGPAEAGRTACANVKGVARIRVLSGPTGG